MVKVTYYVEVVSSWCFWAEPVWSELKRRYAGEVEFGWKIAEMPSDAFPVSRNQCDWFYRRSGSIVRSPFMLNSDWYEPELRPYSAPNLVAEAARDLGVSDDRVRLAISHAGLREGKKVGRWDVVVPIAAAAAGLEPVRLRARAESAEVAARVAATSAEFHALQVNQRPTFLIESDIGDRAVFSGIVRGEPLAAAIDVLLADSAGYASWKAHFGGPPSV
jgi:predicted DsbA family dithiol-disulfide isomerase